MGLDAQVRIAAERVGVSLGAIATNTHGLALFNELIGRQSASAVDSVTELDALAAQFESLACAAPARLSAALDR